MCNEAPFLKSNPPCVRLSEKKTIASDGQREKISVRIKERKEKNWIIKTRHEGNKFYQHFQNRFQLGHQSMLLLARTCHRVICRFHFLVNGSRNLFSLSNSRLKINIDWINEKKSDKKRKKEENYEIISKLLSHLRQRVVYVGICNVERIILSRFACFVSVRLLHEHIFAQVHIYLEYFFQLAQLVLAIKITYAKVGWRFCVP